MAKVESPLDSRKAGLPAAGEAGIKIREVHVEDEEKRRLKSVVASLSVEPELLREKIAPIEGGGPLVSWKSRP